MLTRLSFLRRSHLPCSVDYPTRHTWKKKRRRFISVAEEGRKALCDGSSARRTVPGRLGASFLGRAILLLVGGVGSWRRKPWWLEAGRGNETEAGRRESEGKQETLRKSASDRVDQYG
jgi:hypothetical protein